MLSLSMLQKTRSVQYARAIMSVEQSDALKGSNVIEWRAPRIDAELKNLRMAMSTNCDREKPRTATFTINNLITN